MAPAPPSFTCPVCLLVSYNSNDRIHRFCVRCGFLDDMPERVAAALEARYPGQVVWVNGQPTLKPGPPVSAAAVVANVIDAAQLLVRPEGNHDAD